MSAKLKHVICPACTSPEISYEVGDRYQCDRCGWRFIVDDLGRTKDYITGWMGKPKRKRRGR